MVLEDHALEWLAALARAEFELVLAEKLRVLRGQSVSADDRVRLVVTASVSAPATDLVLQPTASQTTDRPENEGKETGIDPDA